MSGKFASGPVVRVNGVRLATLQWRGSGPPLYLMHATGFCGAMWDPVAVALSDVSTPRAMDVRGHGASDRPDTDYPWNLFADDLLAWIHQEHVRPHAVQEGRWIVGLHRDHVIDVFEGREDPRPRNE